MIVRYGLPPADDDDYCSNPVHDADSEQGKGVQVEVKEVEAKEVRLKGEEQLDEHVLLDEVVVEYYVHAD